jgi:hypothetical protein
MPLIVLWGHGIHEAWCGYFDVPRNVEIHFFVPDGRGLGSGPARVMARELTSSLVEDPEGTTGISTEIMDKARKLEGGDILGVEVFRHGDRVKNYTLESMVGLPFGDRDEKSVRSACQAHPSICMSPGIGVTGPESGEARSHLHYVVCKYLHKAKKDDPLVIHWAACREDSIENSL